MGFSVIGVVMLAQSMSLVDIVEAQAGLWNVVYQPLGFFVFFVAAIAEAQRIPFDLPEAEGDLGAGYHTEYSGMRFSMFFLAEYANMLVISALVVVLFWGGWLRPFPNVAALSFLDFIPSWVWFFGKMLGFLYLFIWIRATLPRYRYDQLMRLGWKVLIPIAIGNIVVTAVVKVLL